MNRSTLVFTAFTLFGLFGCADIGDDLGGTEEDTSTSTQSLSGTRHHQTTQVGVAPWLSNASTLDALVTASRIGDTNSATNIHSETHFDNCYWEEGRAWVASKRRAAVQAALRFDTTNSASDKQAVIDSLGYVLHATQDFYAHSNWVETHDSGVIAPFDELPTRPANWHSGTYDNSGDSGVNAGYLHCPVGMRVTHSAMNKDGVGGAAADEAFVDAAAASGDQIRRFMSLLREVSPSNADSLLVRLGFDPSGLATTAVRADYSHTVAPVGGGWGQYGSSVFCPAGSYVAAFRQKVEAAQGAGDDTALNAIEFYCRNNAGVNTLRLNTWDGAWGSWSAWRNCPVGAFVTGGVLKVESSQGTGDDTSANAARFTCSSGGTLTANNDGAWGTFRAAASCGAGTVVCGAQTFVEPPIAGGDDTALNGIRLHCCTR